ncbi:DUF5131 family protein [Prosthecochloris sp.]|uniref:DUF5131 family protein n=1 Tax=Prosthecochloris sp. TaxID=290513 RepID=UPI00257D0722|nr:DUF5131 family protein [Prosthecochloris sp.]
MTGKWWDQGWTLVSGCTAVSVGCDNCWAMAMEKRLMKGSNGCVQFHNDRLARPLRRKKSTTYAIWNDLFHEDIADLEIDRVMGVISASPQHKYFLLTKRAKRMQGYFANRELVDRVSRSAGWLCQNGDDVACNVYQKDRWPLPNLALGVSVENQETADNRVWALLQTQAAYRFINIGPALGPVDFCKTSEAFPHQDTQHPWHNRPILGGVDLVMMEGESGRHARDWPGFDNAARSVRDQCKATGVPFFLKQMPKKRLIPEDLKIRETIQWGP